MSLASSPDVLFRPEDKAMDMLFPTMTDTQTNTFDQYLNDSVFLSSDNEDNKGHIDDYVDFFEKDVKASTQVPIGGPHAGQESTSPQPWRKGLWCLNQNGSSQRTPMEWKSPSGQNANHTIPTTKLRPGLEVPHSAISKTSSI